MHDRTEICSNNVDIVADAEKLPINKAAAQIRSANRSLHGSVSNQIILFYSPAQIFFRERVCRQTANYILLNQLLSFPVWWSLFFSLFMTFSLINTVSTNPICTNFTVSDDIIAQCARQMPLRLSAIAVFLHSNSSIYQPHRFWRNAINFRWNSFSACWFSGIQNSDEVLFEMRINIVCSRLDKDGFGTWTRIPMNGKHWDNLYKPFEVHIWWVFCTIFFGRSCFQWVFFSWFQWALRQLLVNVNHFYNSFYSCEITKLSAQTMWLIGCSSWCVRVWRARLQEISNSRNRHLSVCTVLVRLIR